MIKTVCSPNSSGVKPKPQPLPHPPLNKVKHTHPWGPLIKDRSDQVTRLPMTEQPPPAPSTSRGM